MKEKHIVAFLGNPGKEYAHTRHNAAWIVAGRLFDDSQFCFNKYANADIAQVDASYLENHPASKYRQMPEVTNVNTELLLVKPQTFMNLSGDAIDYIARKELIDPSHIVVVYDDIDIPVGEFRISVGGGSNHNGIKSIISKFGKTSFVRLRIGVGSEKRDIPLRGFVLGNLSRAEEESLERVAVLVFGAIADIVQCGVVYAQNKYNKK